MADPRDPPSPSLTAPAPEPWGGDLEADLELAAMNAAPRHLRPPNNARVRAGMEKIRLALLRRRQGGGAAHANAGTLALPERKASSIGSIHISEAVAVEEPGAAALAPPTALTFEGREIPFRAFPKWRLDIDRAGPRVRKHLVDYRKFATVPPETEGAPSTSDFSSTMPAQSAQIHEILRAFLYDPRTQAAGPRKVVLDLTAHVGVDTANTAVVYPGSRVVAVELDPLTAALHKRNMRELGLAERVETVGGDSVALVLANKLPPSDLALVDPPWGGPDYWKEKKFTPSMGSIGFDELVATLLGQGVALTVASKLPVNVDVERYSAAVKAKAPGAKFYTWEIHKLRRPRGSPASVRPVRRVSFLLMVATVDPTALPPEEEFAAGGAPRQAPRRRRTKRGGRGGRR
jgi:hypothetical protein